MREGVVRGTFLASVLGINRSSLYASRRRETKDKRLGKRPKNALTEEEKQIVLNCMNSEEFCDETPYEIVPRLMERGVWHCSIRTMYRILNENKAIKDRRNQLRHPKYVKPVLSATGPNQVWTWDITRVQGPFKGRYYYLYVMIDLYSRYIVGWTVNAAENSESAQHFIRETVRKHQVDPENLSIHSDRGSPMTASNTVNLLSVLGLTQSFARPRTSNDNPYSESQFKTLKYHRLFKQWFKSTEDANESLDKFFLWYNKDHMHSGLGLMTPETVHLGRVKEVAALRWQTLRLARKKNPERFSRPIKVALPPAQVGINLPKDTQPAIRYLQP